MKHSRLFLTFAGIFAAVTCSQQAIAEEKQSPLKTQVVEVPSSPLETRYLLKRCSLGGNLLSSQGVVYCAGYLGGAIETYRTVGIIQSRSKIFCAPILPPKERQRIFVDWATAHPEAANRPASESILAAFSEIYPCVE